MKKKIKALILAIFIGVSSFFNNIVASATVPGVVGAENVWQLWETLAFTLGVSLSFDDSKTISYNNDYQRQALMDQIQSSYDSGYITQAQYEDCVQNIDNIIEDANTHGIGNVIDIGENLWSQLTQFYYKKYIEQSVNLISSLSPSVQQIFNNYQGKCAIYAQIHPQGDSSTPYAYVFFGSGCLSSPVRGDSGSIAGVPYTYWTIYNSSSSDGYYCFSNNSTVYSGYSSRGDYFVGDNILVQYFDYKAVNETIVDTNNDDALVSFPSYQDYVNKLNDIYELLNGQIVVTDTQEAPTILDGETVGNAVAGIQDGTTTWEDAVPIALEADDAGTIEGDNPIIGKKALNEMVSGLRINRLKTKFPFCIPRDIKNIVAGAATVSGNAPVIEIPLHLEFKNHVFYDSDQAVVIDLNDFAGVAEIFRTGFLLLFLVGLIYLSIYIIQSFFQITE